MLVTGTLLSWGGAQRCLPLSASMVVDFVLSHWAGAPADTFWISPCSELRLWLQAAPPESIKSTNQ